MPMLPEDFPKSQADIDNSENLPEPPPDNVPTDLIWVILILALAMFVWYLLKVCE